MKNLLLVIIAAFAFNAIPVVYADDEPGSGGESLPAIAPVDDPAIPPLSPPSPDDYKN